MGSKLAMHHNEPFCFLIPEKPKKTWINTLEMTTKTHIYTSYKYLKIFYQTFKPYHYNKYRPTYNTQNETDKHFQLAFILYILHMTVYIMKSPQKLP